jgi:mannan endo-1,4-beta-mannosidase
MTARWWLFPLLAAACSDLDFGGPPPEPPCAPLPPIDGFVSRDGARLIAGGRPLRALGANIYYLQQLFTYSVRSGDPSYAAPALAALDQAVCLQMPVIRANAFNDSDDTASIRPQPGLYLEQGLRGLDRAVVEAKQRGLRLILVLTNYHRAYGGLPAYAAWAGRSPDDFFADAAMQGYWKEYVTFLLDRLNPETGLRYRDEPAIFAWEIANELRCPPCRGTTRTTDTVAALARHLRAAGARQLIADGSEGFDDAPELHPGLSNTYAVRGEDGMSFSRLLGVPELDLVSYHLYPNTWGLSADADAALWIDRHTQMARAAGKVAYLGEFGHRARNDRARAAVYDSWLERLYRDRDGSLALLWQLIPASRRLQNNDDGYGVVPGTDRETTAALYRAARSLAEP